VPIAKAIWTMNVVQDVLPVALDITCFVGKSMVDVLSLLVLLDLGLRDK